MPRPAAVDLSASAPPLRPFAVFDRLADSSTRQSATSLIGRFPLSFGPNAVEPPENGRWHRVQLPYRDQHGFPYSAYRPLPLHQSALRGNRGVSVAVFAGCWDQGVGRDAAGTAAGLKIVGVSRMYVRPKPSTPDDGRHGDVVGYSECSLYTYVSAVAGIQQ